MLYRQKVHFTSIRSFDSSVGRAVDCRGVKIYTDIHRSLVRIRLEGLYVFFLFFSPKLFISPFNFSFAMLQLKMFYVLIFFCQDHPIAVD